MIFMQRTPLKDRKLPDYTRGEEIFNMVTHIVGGGLAVVILVACVTVAAIHKNIAGVITSIVYGLSMIMLYTMSSVYHGVPRSYAKKVLQVIDHCTVYFLIVGTYTPIAVCALTKVSKAVGWTVFGVVWALAAVAITLTAIDLRKFRVFSMICYIGMGWCIIFAVVTTYRARGLYTACRGRRALHVRRDTLRTRRKAPLYALGFPYFCHSRQPRALLLHSALCAVRNENRNHTAATI